MKLIEKLLVIVFTVSLLYSECTNDDCGPPLMMESIRSYAIDNQFACDLALETIMACGFGICQGCTVIKKLDDQIEHSYRNHFALACMDGPIFNANEIVTCR